MRRDPAARNKWEVLLMYPGIHALTLHRLSHALWRRRMRFLARWISHIGRFVTGIEIHPGATVGRRVFIDHGMGIVIGETAEIGDDVLLYQGVVLGGTSTEKAKRHPTLENGVIVGAGAIVLGPIVVGREARVGAGSVVVKEVPAGATVVGVPARIAARRGGKDDSALEHGELPDPVVRALSKVFDRESELEARIATLEQALDRLPQGAPAPAAPHLTDDQLEGMVLEHLRGVLDPEVGVNVVDLGLIRRVHVCGGDAHIDMVFTSPACPMAGELVEQVRKSARNTPGVERVQVTLLDEPWQWEWFVLRNNGGETTPDIAAVAEQKAEVAGVAR
jgi:serine O-acetyltransferase